MDPFRRAEVGERIADVLRDLLSPVAGCTVGFYWPYRGEVDLRALMRELIVRGARGALPAVTRRGRPLVYRPWHPGSAMRQTAAGIPVPATCDTVRPDVVVIPLLGFDDDNHRLGLGSGYVDRTLAAFERRPWTIGVGYEHGRLATIHPWPHDVALDLIVTEAGTRLRTRDDHRPTTA